jgi:polar amino acid transport system substrate-binding protein
MDVTSDIKRELAPTGRLRVSINLGNPILCQPGPGGNPKGVTPELAAKLGERLGLPVDLALFNAAGTTFDALARGELDIVFLARDPVRAKEIDFTAPYVLIEGYFLVPQASPLKTMTDIDRAGARIAVAKGAAYDLFLTRAIKNAELVRFVTTEESMDAFLAEKMDAAAGVKQPLVGFMKEHPGYRLIEPRFMAIEQAMGTPVGRPKGVAFLRSFIEEMKASGFVGDALTRSNQHDAVVAPPETVS